MKQSPKQTHFSMFKPFDNTKGYTRCIVAIENVQEFERLGFYHSPHLFPKGGDANAGPHEEQVQDHEGHERQEDDGQENDGSKDDEKAQEVAYVTDGDKGDGCRPDSKEWHKRVVSQMESKDEIADYIEKLTGTVLNTRRHHHNFVVDALAQIDAHYIRVDANARYSSDTD